jgi:acetyltransferase-like isoleucine patch superfamily enzyme
VGRFVEIQRDVQIGKRVRIQSHTFICSGIVIEDDVFIGHNVNFINDRHPTVPKAEDGSWSLEGSRVCRGASIGTGAVVLCGVTIGEGAAVGAGSVVTKDVAPHTMVVGVPAHFVRELSSAERWDAGGSDGTGKTSTL